MLTVICPIYNEEKYIARCIESIMQQDYPKDDLEVLFVDGMSTDHTREIIANYLPQCPYLKVLDNPDRIVPPAMNIGIRAAKGDVIIRLDAHAIFPANYFSELVRYLFELKAENVGGVCRTLPVRNDDVCNSIAAVLSSSFGMGNSYFRVGAKEIMEVDTVPFGCFHRSIFDRIGYFDEELIRNQDDEFNGRIIKNGGKIYLLPNIVMDYYARDTEKKVFKMFYQYGLFKPLVNKKLGSPATIRQFFPLCFVLGLIGGLVLSVFSKWIMILYVSVLILYFGLSTYFSLKDSSNLKRIAIQNWTYFVVHFGYGWGYIVGLIKIAFKRPFVAKVNR